MYSPWNGIAIQNNPIANKRSLSGSLEFNSLPFQNRLLNPTLSNPVWIRAEVVETDVTSADSGTISLIQLEVLLRIALHLGGLGKVLGYSTLHPALPNRRY
tara:strand:+ start:569 stop:871 length:303 start_codon:yes stop_codon:yes gene_type:complete